MPNINLTPEKYSHWLTPRQTVEALKAVWAFDVARSELSTRLQHGLIRAAFELCVTKQHGKERERETFAIMSASQWNDRDSSPDSHFWNAGSIEIHHREYQRDYTLCFFGVRFDSDQVAALVDAQLNTFAAVPTGGVQTQNIGPSRPTVSAADLQRWHEVFSLTHPAAPEAAALRSAAAMFPDNNVPRQMVRDLRGPQKLGKPPIRH